MPLFFKKNFFLTLTDKEDLNLKNFKDIKTFKKQHAYT